jgi:PAS domain S-box-containing protein
MTGDDETLAEAEKVLAALRQRLTEAEARFGALAGSSADLIVRQAPDATVRYVSPACVTLLGRDAEAMVGRRFYDFVHPEDRAILVQAQATLTEPGLAATRRCRLQAQEDTYPLFEVSSQALAVAGGEVEILSICRDISARSRLEQELADAKVLLEAAFEQTPIPMILASAPDAVIQIMNSASQEFLGIEDERPYLGQPLLNLPQTWQHFDAQGRAVPADELPLALAFKEIIVKNREYRVVRQDGTERWELMTGTPIYNGQGQVMAGFVASPDITDRKRAELLLQTYAARLERSNQDLQDFASSASHDLQEPLRKVTMFGERLMSKHGGDLPAEAQDWLARMVGAASRMQAMINALLDYSRVTTKAQPFAWVSLAQVAMEAVTDLEVSLEETAGRVDLGDLPQLEADPLQMRLLLQNLIGNALKFHRPGVPPVVTVRGQLLPSGQATIQVADNGIGFDNDYDAPRLFRPFERLNGRSEYEGSGMGLAICRKIVERHEGQITAQSPPGGGAVFVVTLPVRHLKVPDSL